jgi:hypothetical protein
MPKGHHKNTKYYKSSIRTPLKVVPFHIMHCSNKIYYSTQELKARAPILLACSVLSEYNTACSSRYM